MDRLDRLPKAREQREQGTLKGNLGDEATVLKLCSPITGSLRLIQQQVLYIAGKPL